MIYFQKHSPELIHVRINSSCNCMAPLHELSCFCRTALVYKLVYRRGLSICKNMSRYGQKWNLKYEIMVSTFNGQNEIETTESWSVPLMDKNEIWNTKSWSVPVMDKMKLELRNHGQHLYWTKWNLKYRIIVSTFKSVF